MNRGLVIGVVVGAVAVVGVALFGIPKRGWGWQSKGKNEIQVTLNPTASGCTVDPIADVLGGKKNAKIRWKVKNNCSTSQYIRFQNFQRWHLTDDDKDPADNGIVDPSQPGGSVAAGATADFDATIQKDPQHGPWFDTYKYDVYLGADASSLTKVFDPDVEIWP